jgi:hypothetical protein
VLLGDGFPELLADLVTTLTYKNTYINILEINKKRDKKKTYQLERE